MSDNKPIETVLVFGAGGHARSVIDVLESEGKYTIVALIDSIRSTGDLVFGYSCAGTEEDLPGIAARFACNNVVVAIGDNYQRQAASERLLTLLPTLNFVTTVHPSAVVSRRCELSQGCVVMAGAVVNAGSVLADGCLVNTSAVVDHDCQLKSFSSVGTGAALGGAVSIGSRTSIGLGASVLHRISIGDDTVIGAGSTVTRDVPAMVVAYGSPSVTVRGRSTDDAYL